MSNLDETDPTFVEDLAASNAAVRKVAAWLCDVRKTPVLHMPTYVRPDPSERAAYADHGDLWIQQRVEVKHRPGISFHAVREFPYEWVIVDVAENYDRARPKPFLYFICNSEIDGALLVECRTTFKRWRRTKKYDSHAGRVREFYECPCDLCSYLDIGTGVA